MEQATSITAAPRGMSSNIAVVALITSTGGLNALSTILKELKPDFPAAIVVAQYLGGTARTLVEILGRRTTLPVAWIEDGCALAPGMVQVCPPLQHVEVLPDGTCALTPSPHGVSSKPLDFLLTSLADSYGPRAMAVVLTGMGNDGAAGAQALKQADGMVFVQSEDTAKQPAMPHAVIELDAADLVLPLDEIGPNIVRVVSGSRLSAQRMEVHQQQKERERLEGLTERRRAEPELRTSQEELRAANERLTQVLESIDEVFYAVDAHWRLTYLNHHAEEIWQHSRQELLGTVLWDMFPNYQETEDYRQHVKAMEERTSRHAEFPSPNLHTWVEVNIYPQADGGLAIYFRDIGERKRAEQQLAHDLDAMTRLQQLGALSVQASNLESVLLEVVDAAIAISGADFGNIHLLDPASGDLRIAAQRGFPPWWHEFWDSVARGQGACGTALERGERIIIEDVEQSPIFVGKPALDIQRRAGVRAVQSTPLVSRSGKPVGMFSTHYRAPRRPDDSALRLLDLLARQAADIIEHSQAEEALRLGAQRLQRVMETDAVGLLFFDQAGTLIQANDVFLHMTGYTCEQIERGELTWRKMTPPEWIAESEAQLERFAQTGRVGPYEKEYFLADGSRRWMLFAGRDLGDGSIVEYCIDINDRKRAESQREAALEALRQREQELQELNEQLENRVAERTAWLSDSEAKFRALVETTAQIVWTTDAAGRVVEDSPSWRAFTGQTFEGRLDRGWLDVVHPDDREYARRDWQSAVKTRQPLDTGFRLWHAATRTWHVTALRAAPLYNEDGTVRAWVGMNTDLTP